MFRAICNLKAGVKALLLSFLFALFCATSNAAHSEIIDKATIILNSLPKSVGRDLRDSGIAGAYRTELSLKLLEYAALVDDANEVISDVNGRFDSNFPTIAQGLTFAFVGPDEAIAYRAGLVTRYVALFAVVDGTQLSSSLLTVPIPSDAGRDLQDPNVLMGFVESLLAYDIKLLISQFNIIRAFQSEYSNQIATKNVDQGANNGNCRTVQQHVTEWETRSELVRNFDGTMSTQMRSVPVIRLRTLEIC